MANRQTSQDGLALIRHVEGTILHVYKDARGLLTVATGHLVRAADGLELGDTISEDRAAKFLEDDLALAEACVNRCCPDLTQHEFDALVSFAYNAGCGNLATLVQDSDGIPAQIAERFSHWTRAGTQHPKGLRIRRALEKLLFTSPDGPMPDGWLTSCDHAY